MPSATVAVCGAGLLSLLDFCLSVAEIVMGARHLGDCPVQAKIPVYLLVAGCCGLVLSLNNAAKSRRMKQLPEQRLQMEQKSSAVDKCINCVLSLMSLFAFVWVICGMVWIFGAAPVYELSSPPGNSTAAAAATPSSYCYQPLHVFAKVSVILRILVVMLYGLIICCACCACCGAFLCMGCCAASSDEEGKEAPEEAKLEQQEAV